MSERTPVLLPAHNEAEGIERTLISLPNDLVEPIVLAGRSTDDTLQIAERFGAVTFRGEAQGKLPEIQAALEHLGSRALKPVLILDADNRPLLPRRWHNGMLAVMQKGEANRPVVVGGPAWFVRGGIIDDAMKSVRRLQRAYQGRQWKPSMTPGQCGPNMGLNLKSTEALEGLLALEHYWPCEDIAMADSVIASGGSFYQPISPTLLTINPSSESYPSFRERLRIGQAESRRRIIADYVARGADGSFPYPGIDRDYALGQKLES